MKFPCIYRYRTHPHIYPLVETIISALGDNLMLNLRLCIAAAIRHSVLKFEHTHLCSKGCKYLSLHCCKCNSFGCIAAIRCGNACHGPHNDRVYSGSEHRQFNSPRLVKREADFPNHGGRWLAKTNYDALMARHTIENSPKKGYMCIYSYTMNTYIRP